MSQGATFDERIHEAHLILTESRTKRLREGWHWVELMLDRMQEDGPLTTESPAMQLQDLPVSGVEVVR